MLPWFICYFSVDMYNLPHRVEGEKSQSEKMISGVYDVPASQPLSLLFALTCNFFTFILSSVTKKTCKKYNGIG